jgi:predicted RNA-binding Zn-ribbon protein involved in translation (DUF1610 family)
MANETPISTLVGRHVSIAEDETTISVEIRSLLLSHTLPLDAIGVTVNNTYYSRELIARLRIDDAAKGTVRDWLRTRRRRAVTTMADRKLFCTKCNAGIIVEREVPAQCPTCGSSSWRCATHPSTPYTLTFNDKSFFRSIRVSADE